MPEKGKQKKFDSKYLQQTCNILSISLHHILKVNIYTYLYIGIGKVKHKFVYSETNANLQGRCRNVLDTTTLLKLFNCALLPKLSFAWNASRLMGSWHPIIYKVITVSIHFSYYADCLYYKNRFLTFLNLKRFDLYFMLPWSVTD